MAEGRRRLISATVENNYYLSGVCDEVQELFPRDTEF